MSLRDSIFAASDAAAPTPCPVPEWGVTVYLRPLSLADFLAARLAAEDEREVTLRVVIGATCDESGAPVFTDADRDRLLALNGAVLSRLACRALAMATPTEATIEAAAKN